MNYGVNMCFCASVLLFFCPFILLFFIFFCSFVLLSKKATVWFMSYR